MRRAVKMVLKCLMKSVGSISDDFFSCCAFLSAKASDYAFNVGIIATRLVSGHILNV